MLRLLKAEVASEPASQQSSATEEREGVQEVPAGGLAGVLAQLRQQGSQARMGDDSGSQANEEHYLKEYLDTKLEEVSCLKYWEKQDREFGSHKVKSALCRLARYSFTFLLVILFISFFIRKFLTAPPTSTDVERLFSAAGLIASDHRGRLAPETLEKLLFLRENILVCNFELDWD